jgi:hypothetical protein
VIYPKAPIFGLVERGSDIYAESAPRSGRRSGRRNRRSDGETPVVPPSGRVTSRFPGRAAFRADGRRVGPMEDTQVWDEVK